MCCATASSTAMLSPCTKPLTEKMEKEQKKEVRGSYPGRFLSYLHALRFGGLCNESSIRANGGRQTRLCPVRLGGTYCEVPRRSCISPSAHSITPTCHRELDHSIFCPVTCRVTTCFVTLGNPYPSHSQFPRMDR